MDAEKFGFPLGTEFLEPYAPVGEKEFLTQCEPSTYCHNQASLLRVLGFLLRLGLPFSLSLPSLQTARFHTKSGRKLTKNLGGGARYFLGSCVPVRERPRRRMQCGEGNRLDPWCVYLMVVNSYHVSLYERFFFLFFVFHSVLSGQYIFRILPQANSIESFPENHPHNGPRS